MSERQTDGWTDKETATEVVSTTEEIPLYKM